MKRFLSIFYDRVPEGKATQYRWHARAYSDWHSFTHVMVLWPFHYLVQFSHWVAHHWDHYRHRKSWIDRQISAAIKHSEQQDARRFIRKFTQLP